MLQPKEGVVSGSRYRVPVNLIIGASQSGNLAAGRLVFSLVALQLAAAPWQVGLLVALFGLFPALFMIQIGRWMDRLGVFVIMAVAVTVSLLSLMHAAWAPTLVSLLVAAPLVGISAVISHVASTRALGIDDNLAIRARNLGYLGACYSLSHFVAPLSAGLVLDTFGSNAVFVFLALLCCLTLAVILFSDRRAVAPIPPRPADPAKKIKVMTLLQMPTLRRWLMANGIFAMALTIFPFVASLHAEAIGLSASTTGWLIGAAAVGSVVIRAFMRKLMDTLTPRAIFVVALAAAGAAYAAFALFQGIAALIIISFVLGLAVGAGMPVVTTMIYTEAPADRVSEALGLSISVSMFLQTLSPLLLGVLASLLGVKAMACILGLMLIVAAWDAYRAAPVMKPGC